MASAARRRVRDLSDVTWPGSPTDAHVLTYDEGTDKIVLAPGGGGLTTDHGSEYNFQEIDTVGAGATAPLTFGPLGWGEPLLDLSDPFEPTIIESGLYTIGVVVQSFGGMTPGKNFSGYLHVDYNGDDAIAHHMSPAQVAGGPDPVVTLPNTWYVHAGDKYRVDLTNHDSVERSFIIMEVMLQRHGS